MKTRTPLHRLGFWVLTLVLSLPASAAAAEMRQLELTILEHTSREPIPCRIHLQNAKGEPVLPEGYPVWRDHFVCDGRAPLRLEEGRYTYQIERGPEYRRLQGAIDLQDNAQFSFVLERLTHLAKEGWWSGELHIHRPTADVPLLLRAEDLHVGPVITWWNKRNLWRETEPPEQLLIGFDENRFSDLMAGEDEREGGALLYFHLPRPLDIAQAGREHPSPLHFVAQARANPRVWIDIEKPFWWDVPVWLAHGSIDSIGLANNHMCRSSMYESEAWGKPRDTDRLPAPRGNGHWTQEIYYHILNSGLRLPPSAGSASGVLPNPVGYNRVYVHLEGPLNYHDWWEGLRAGRSFVSNGPLLRCRANGHWPGQVFAATSAIPIEIEATLTTQDPVAGFEIIRDGQLVRSVPRSDSSESQSLGTITFEESGWFLVRVIADEPRTFRFASTAPFYVEIGEAKRRVSRASAGFFLDWVRERIDRVQVADPVHRQAVLLHHRAAERFWEARVAAATAD